MMHLKSKTAQYHWPPRLSVKLKWPYDFRVGYERLLSIWRWFDDSKSAQHR